MLSVGQPAIILPITRMNKMNESELDRVIPASAQPLSDLKSLNSVLVPALICLGILTAIQIVTLIMSKNEEVGEFSFTHSHLQGNIQEVTPPFELKHGVASVEFKLDAPVDNGWFEIMVELVHETTGKVYGFTQSIEKYSSGQFGPETKNWVDGVKGNEVSAITLPSIPEGLYHLNIKPVYNASQIDAIPYKITVNRDVVTWGNFMLAFVLIIFYVGFWIASEHESEVSAWFKSK